MTKNQFLASVTNAAHHALLALLEHAEQNDASIITATLIGGKVDAGIVSGSPKMSMPLPDPVVPHAPQPANIPSLGSGAIVPSSPPTATLALIGTLLAKLYKKFA